MAYSRKIACKTWLRKWNMTILSFKKESEIMVTFKIIRGEAFSFFVNHKLINLF